MIKCPHCGGTWFSELYTTSTSLYYPIVHAQNADNFDPNYTTHYCRCNTCQQNFCYQTRRGEIIDEETV